MLNKEMLQVISVKRIPQLTVINENAPDIIVSTEFDKHTVRSEETLIIPTAYVFSVKISQLSTVRERVNMMNDIAEFSYSIINKDKDAKIVVYYNGQEGSN